MNFLNNYMRSSKQNHFPGPLEKTGEKATSIKLTILLFLKDQQMRCICKVTLYLLNPGKGGGRGDKNVTERLQEQDQGSRPGSPVPPPPAVTSGNSPFSFSVPGMMDSIFYAIVSKQWERGEAGDPITKHNIGKVRDTQGHFTRVWINAIKFWLKSLVL